MLDFNKQPYEEYRKMLLKGLTPKQRKNLVEANEFLGNDYLIRYVDGEPCIYRDLGNGYDIEVSHVAKPTKENGYCYSIYVWTNNGMWRVVKTVHKIKGLQELKERLEEIVLEFKDKQEN